MTQVADETRSANSSLHPPRIHHVGILTTRHDEMVDWYRTVVGMEVTLKPDKLPGTFVSNDVAHHRMGIFQAPGLQEDTDKVAHARIQHIAFEYPNLGELLESWERIRNSGIEHVAAVDHGSSISIYYKDPDSNTIELECDAWATKEEALQYFSESEQMKENPMGRYVDPAKLLEAWRGGASLEEIHEAAMAAGYEPDVLPDPMATI
jgi:catechol 2,3-dioxygenase